jgi:acyl carrier protein
MPAPAKTGRLLAIINICPVRRGNRFMSNVRPSHVTEGNGGIAPEELELANLMVTSLNLEIAATEIEPQAPLYGEGLGLDSIDILELSLAISKKYGVKLRSDDENNTKIFSSLRSLSQYIQAHRLQ